MGRQEIVIGCGVSIAGGPASSPRRTFPILVEGASAHITPQAKLRLSKTSRVPASAGGPHAWKSKGAKAARMAELQGLLEVRGGTSGETQIRGRLMR